MDDGSRNGYWIDEDEWVDRWKVVWMNEQKK